jgi:hypothetical protein
LGESRTSNAGMAVANTVSLSQFLIRNRGDAGPPDERSEAFGLIAESGRQ